MVRAIYDFSRASVAAVAIFAAGGFATGRPLTVMQPLEGMMGPGPVQPEVAVRMGGGQNQGTDMTPQDFSMLQWGLREGGAFAVILIILFFYRRDWKTAVDFWRDQHAITTDLVQQATKAQVETAAALRENTVVTHGLKNVIAKCAGPADRRFDDRP